MGRFLRNRLAVLGAALVVATLIVALAAPWLAPANPAASNLEEIMQSFSRAHPTFVILRRLQSGRLEERNELVSGADRDCRGVRRRLE